MLPNPLGLRLDPASPVREQIRAAAAMGVRGVVVDAVGDLAPARLSDTGRREIRHLLRSVEMSLVALNLPTRRPFDTIDQLDDRLNRAESAFAMAYELGTTLVLANVGGIPPEANALPRETFHGAIRELARRADHRGVRLAVEASSDAGSDLRALFEGIASNGLAASIDPSGLLQHGHDPAEATRALGPWVAHAYASDATGSPLAATLARRAGMRPGGLDWEEYLGALEESNYRGFLTVWPDPARDTATQFKAVVARLASV